MSTVNSLTIPIVVNSNTRAYNVGNTITSGDTAVTIEITWSDITTITGTVNLHFALGDGSVADRDASDGVVLADNKVTYTLEAGLTAYPDLNMWVEFTDSVILTPLKISFSKIRVKPGGTSIETTQVYPSWAAAMRVIGAYSALTAYAIGNRVTYSGSCYECVAATTAGTLPTDTDYWVLVASKGDTGASGPNSVTTATSTDLTGLIAGSGSAIRAATSADGDALPIGDAGSYFATDTLGAAMQQVGASLAQIGLQVNPAILSVINTLNKGQKSVAIGCISDSTANENTEWVHLFGEALAAKYPAYNVKYCSYNTSTNKFNTWESIQNAGTERSIRMISGKECFELAKADIPITSGDLDVAFTVSLDQWNKTSARNIISRYGVAGTRSWFIGVTATNNYFALYWSANGTDLLSASFTTYNTTALTAGGKYTFRITLDVDDGAGHYVAKLYSSTDDGYSWTTLETITGGSTTSIFDHATQGYLIGGYGTSSMDGNIYEVVIRDGINGAIASPQPVEVWKNKAAAAFAGGSVVGNPTIYIFNGAAAGYGIVNFIDAPTVKKILPPCPDGIVFISFSHNDTFASGSTYTTNFASAITNIRARALYSKLFLVTQNPKIAPADYIYDHEKRIENQVDYAINSSISVIDAHNAFYNDSRGIDALTEADGIHPNVDGEALITDTVKKYFGIT